ncbi:MAG: hypothetical protein DI536_34955 [Archangium gephyra]|uniref:Uncharacterized protein n=1 Tax=Archangium gephyra TaxID=48 RepID=A0A2W5SMA7_9BACT|nr:MAG: hypothetical protein DI536_34955 [Archangium gephyra]
MALSIRTMVSFGEWVHEYIESLAGRDDKCMRCGNAIKHVHVLRHQGQQHRIGSCCGPLLVDLSESV